MKIKVLYSPYSSISEGTELEVKSFDPEKLYPYLVYRDTQRYQTITFAENEVEVINEKEI